MERKNQFLSRMLFTCLMVAMVLSAFFVTTSTVFAEVFDLSMVGSSHVIAEKHAYWKGGHRMSEFPIGTEDPVIGIFELNSGHKFTELKEGVDYKIISIDGSHGDVTNSFDKNVPGHYTYVIEGMGNYKGRAVVESFTLYDPYAAQDPSSGGILVRGVTIQKVSRLKKGFKVYWNTSNEINATGYQIRYSLKSSMANAKTVTVKSVSTSSQKVKKLKAKKKYYIQIRAYKSVGGEKYYSEWSAKKTVKTK